MAYVRWSSSDWYIFWESNNIEDGDLEGKDDQLLAIWNCRDESEYLSFTYPQVKDILANDNWHKYYQDVTERDVLLSCVNEWIEDVEKDCLGLGYLDETK